MTPIIVPKAVIVAYDFKEIGFNVFVEILSISKFNFNLRTSSGLLPTHKINILSVKSENTKVFPFCLIVKISDVPG